MKETDITQLQGQLEEALKELEGLAQKPQRGRPNRYDARALLIPLGTLLDGIAPSKSGEPGTPDLANSPSHVLIEQALARTAASAARLQNRWEDAVMAELSLACAEHVHAVDPRYLDLPNYDFEYTARARGRLEARLMAAERLGLELPAELLQGVHLADDRLAAHIKKATS